uniref:Uncharacterized protein n=1 Tax=Cannabis sativa TaxID=3483 RepID=A0A803Q6N8_CANSA
MASLLKSQIPHSKEPSSSNIFSGLQPLNPAFLSLNPLLSFRDFEPTMLPPLHFLEVCSCPCFEQAALGLGTYAASRVDVAPPLAMCPFVIFPPVLAPVEAAKEEPEVSE